jgi:hypothetical protein
MNLIDQFKEFVASTITEWISGEKRIIFLWEVSCLGNLGAQATADSYKHWKIRADARMITSDKAEGNSSSNDSLYFVE